jgi:hypothetical protein
MQFFRSEAKTFERLRPRVGGIMARLLIVSILFAVGAADLAKAAPPEFDTSQFCGGFAENHGGGNMGNFARTVCVMSEDATKEIVEKAWDHVSADGQEQCLRKAGQSYAALAQCLNRLPAH